MFYKASAWGQGGVVLEDGPGVKRSTGKKGRGRQCMRI